MKRFVVFSLLFLYSTSYGLVVSFGGNKKKPASFANSQKYSDVVIAEYEKIKGNIEQSFKLFNRLGDSDWADKEILMLLEKQHRYDLIVNYEDKFKDDLQAQLVVFRAFINLNQPSKAEGVLLSLIERFTDDFSVNYYYVVFLIGQKRFGEALRLLDKTLLLKQSSSNKALLFFLKAKIYFDQDKLDLATLEADKALDVKSSFDKAWLIKAMIAERRGDVDEAIKSYKSILEYSREYKDIAKRLVILLFSKQRFREAEKVLLEIGEDTSEHFFDLALVQWKAKKYGDALINIEKVIKRQPALDLAWNLKIEILLSMKNDEAVALALESWILQDIENIEPLKYFMTFEKKGFSFSKIIKILKKFEDYKDAKNYKNILACLGDCYLKNGDLGLAAGCYKKVLDLTTDESLRGRILYSISFISLKDRNGQKLDELLSQLEVYKDKSSEICNLLASFYLEKNHKIDYALSLIDKSLEIEPNNIAYIDTKACLLLKKGKKQKAKYLLKKALVIDPANKTLKDRYKQCH